MPLSESGARKPIWAYEASAASATVAAVTTLSGVMSAWLLAGLTAWMPVSAYQTRTLVPSW